jgi:hypothetical protein
MGCEGSLLCLEEFTCPHPELDESNPHPRIIIFKIYFNNILKHTGCLQSGLTSYQTAIVLQMSVVTTPSH